MRKTAILLSIILVLALAACTQTPQQVTPATTPDVGEGVATTAPLATDTTEPAETATTEVEATAAMTEAPVTTETPAAEGTVSTEAAGTPAAEGTAAIDTGTVTPAVDVTASPVVTGTAVLPGTGDVDLGRASNLIGQPVADVNGQVAGEVQDLAIDLSNRQVAYVILQVTNEEDGEQQSVPVPWAAFSFSPGAPVSLTIDNETLAGATTIDIRAVPILIPEDWAAEFGAFWTEVLGETGAEATEPPAAATTETPEAETGMEGIVLAADFIGKELQTPDGQSIGMMDHLVLDLETGEVTFVILSAGEALGVGERVVPIPLSVLNRNIETRTFTLPVDPSMLANAPSFDLGSLPETTAQDWEVMLQDFWNQFLTP